VGSTFSIISKMGVAAAVIAAVVTSASPAAADVDTRVGERCYQETPVYNAPVACVWMNVDHTNNRIRGYARAVTGGHNQDVAVWNIRLQKLSSDATAWRDVPGTLVGDLDGWQYPQDDAATTLWNCLGPGSYRTYVHWQVKNVLGNITTSKYIASGSYSYGQVYNC
jgi:hypothetical protein